MKVTESKILRDLEAIRAASMEANAFVPALRATELMGKHIGMWREQPAEKEGIAELVGRIPRLPEADEDPVRR